MFDRDVDYQSNYNNNRKEKEEKKPIEAKWEEGNLKGLCFYS